jgi:hypothetical protein
MRTIPLTQGKQVMVDDEDYESLIRWKWCYANATAVRGLGPRGKQRLIYMHRQIMDPPEELYIDHINGDRLDNRRSNLRICTHAENQRNRKATVGSSKYKGVGFFKRDRKWAARIRFNSKLIHLGYFDNEIDAAKAHDKAARELHGEFARTNF